MTRDKNHRCVKGCTKSCSGYRETAAQKSTNNVIVNFRKRFRSCVHVRGGRIEQSLKQK